MEAWSIITGIVLAALAQALRGPKKIPNVVSLLVLIVCGLGLYWVGLEQRPANPLEGSFLQAGAAWLLALRGLGALLAEVGALPPSNTL